MQNSRPPGAHCGGHGGGGRVERQRAQILDDDEIGRRQGIVQLLAGGRGEGIDRQTLEKDIDRAGAGHRQRVPTEVLQRPGPFLRLDRDAVTPPQPEREERGSRHAAAL